LCELKKSFSTMTCKRKMTQSNNSKQDAKSDWARGRN
jgi:hypothetical protein